MVDIVQMPKRTNKDAVEMLKEAIYEIEQGYITDVAIAYVTTQGGIGYSASDGERGILLGAAISMADRIFHRDIIDREAD
jgi:hypothetical protein